MKMLETTRLAIQSAVAVSIATMISLLLPFDKVYWIILTSMALSVQTWGESIKKAVERVLMTILGGTVGTFLYFYLPHETYLLLTMAMIFMFLAVYLIQINHQIGVFSITALVVFLFALAANWNLSLLGYRIMDTLIGAMIALMVSYLFSGESKKRYDQLIDFWQQWLRILQHMVDHPTEEPLISNKALYADYVTLRNQVLAARYEMLFHRYNRKQFLQMLRLTGLISQNLSLLLSTQSWYGHSLDESEQAPLKESILLTMEQIKQLILSLQTGQAVTFKSPRPLINQALAAIKKEPKRFLLHGDEGFTFYRMTYYLYRINVRIIETGALIAKKARFTQ